ncbi:MAG: hypothetical protein JWL74_489 [Alphaproteobacteria bacterium]|jgi:hypothetical protein|nr:hypothetical protein [Alphaproteobacteria bacterium]
MKLGISAATAGIFAAATASVSPAVAQPGVATPQAGLTFTREERTALAPVAQALTTRNWAAAAAALPAAQAASLSPSARYAVGRFELDLGRGTVNAEQQLRGIERILSSGSARPGEIAALLQLQAQIYNDRREYERAEGALNRLAQLQPNDPDTLALLGQLSRTRENSAQALTLFRRSLAASDAAGRRVPESRYKLALALALQGNQRESTADLARRLVAAYPSATNWRDALLSYRDVAQLDAASTLDLWRLLRASGALAGERDYLAAANAFDQANLAGEAKAVLDAGVASNMLRASEGLTRTLITRVDGRATTERGGLAARVATGRSAATGAPARTAADLLLAHGRHAEAAELYRLAATKGGEDSDLVNLRLGEALALAGQTVEAQAALQAVAGQRAELARLWLTWLAQRPSVPAAG